MQSPRLTCERERLPSANLLGLPAPTSSGGVPLPAGSPSRPFLSRNSILPELGCVVGVLAPFLPERSSWGCSSGPQLALARPGVHLEPHAWPLQTPRDMSRPSPPPRVVTGPPWKSPPALGDAAGLIRAGLSLPDCRPHPHVSDRKLRAWRWGDLPPPSSRNSVRALTGASEHGGGGVGDGGSGVPTLQRRGLCTQSTVLCRPEHAAPHRVVKKGIQGAPSCPQPVSAVAKALAHPVLCPPPHHPHLLEEGVPVAQRFRSPTPGDTLQKPKATFTREFPGEAGASHSPLGLQRFVILSQARHSWPAPLHSRRPRPRRDHGLCDRRLCDRRQGPAPLWASC